MIWCSKAPAAACCAKATSTGARFEPAATTIGEPRLTPHGLRHTAASLAIAAGGNVKIVQQMLGHATANMTLDL
jgi:integrase